MPIKTLGSLGKIRVGRVTGNTHIFFWPYHWNISLQKYTPKFAPNIGKKGKTWSLYSCTDLEVGEGGLDFLGFGILKLCCTRPGRKLGPLPPPPPPPPPHTHTHTRKFSGSAHGIRILKKAISP